MDLKLAALAGVAATLMVVTQVSAQQPVTKTASVTASATIQQIDSTARMITFKTDDGREERVWASSDIRRFSELKVGDKVNLTYYESVVFAVRKPGDPPLSVPTGASNVVSTPGTGALPGGTVAQQTMTTVTVKTVDAQNGVLTVTNPQGHTITRKVDNKAHLNGVKVGDKIDIVYTEALLANVERK